MTPLFHLRKFKWFQTLTKWLDRPIAVKLQGFPFRVTLRLGPNLSLVLASRLAERNERRFFIKAADRLSAKSLWDIGANIGLYGFVFAASGKGTRQTLLIEPDPANVRCLKDTQRRADLAKVEIIEAAVGGTSGKVDFFRDILTGATGQLAMLPNKSFVERHHGAKPPSIQVRQVTLDELLATKEKPDLVKIDIEGAEFVALAGGAELLQQARPVIFLEMSYPFSQVAELLAKNDYRLYDWRSGKAAPQGAFMALAVPRERRALLGDLLEG